MTGFTDKDVPSQIGKCIVVTGGNTGIGFGAAKTLAARGARVLLACRNPVKAEEALLRIRDEVAGADVAFVPLDQADLNSVRQAAEIIAQEPKVDVLLNNAGVMFPPLDRTVQGHEQQFGVNHLGTFALSLLLLPKLAETVGSRIVVTASIAHTMGKIDWDDIDAHKSFKTSQRYSDSKLMNLLFAFELDRRLRANASPVTTVACHPGIAATELMRHMPGPTRIFMPVVSRVFNAADQGAWPALQAATAPNVLGGDYYGPSKLRGVKGASGRAKSSDLARDRTTALRLWRLSAALTGVDYGSEEIA